MATLLTYMPGMGRLRVPVALEEFTKVLSRQVDLSLEADHLDRFNRNFTSSTLPVSFPHAIRPLVAEEVLVETWEEGRTLQVSRPRHHSSPLRASPCCLHRSLYTTGLR